MAKFVFKLQYYNKTVQLHFIRPNKKKRFNPLGRISFKLACFEIPIILSSFYKRPNVFQEVGGQILLQCEASANPPPKFEWLQKLTKVVPKTMDHDVTFNEKFTDKYTDKLTDKADDMNDVSDVFDEKVLLRGTEKFIEFRNISYEQEGQWVCVATNTIKGKFMSRKVSDFELEE